MVTRILLICLLFSVSLCGCASVFRVNSDPLQADVSFYDPKTGTKKSLGKTPLEMKTSAIKEAVGETSCPASFSPS